MPHGVWSVKDERKYKHILKSCRGYGRSKKTCQRIAGATVNRDRRSEGRALSGLGDVLNSDLMKVFVYGSVLGGSLLMINKLKAQKAQ
jgi:hypothetical protein